jgi:hypothetical protein
LVIVLLASALYFHDELTQIISKPKVTTDQKKLIIRDSLTYKKSNALPFYGKTKGTLKNGEEEGAWITYFDNGHVWIKSNYKNGREEWGTIHYKKDGTIDEN